MTFNVLNPVTPKPDVHSRQDWPVERATEKTRRLNADCPSSSRIREQLRLHFLWQITSPLPTKGQQDKVNEKSDAADHKSDKEKCHSINQDIRDIIKPISLKERQKTHEINIGIKNCQSPGGVFATARRPEREAVSNMTEPKVTAARLRKSVTKDENV